jgi:hypothetical protein
VEGGCKGKGRPRVGKRGGWRPRKGKNRGRPLGFCGRKKRRLRCLLTLHPTAHNSFPTSTHRRSTFGNIFLGYYRSNHIFVWWQCCSHGKVFCHGREECRSDLVLLSPARDNHLLVEAEGYVDNQLPRVSDEAGYCSSFIPVYPGPRRIPPGVCPKVSASEGSSANSAQ